MFSVKTKRNKISGKVKKKKFSNKHSRLIFNLQKKMGGPLIRWELCARGHALRVELSKLTDEQYEKLIG